jgi:hypothetical protein
VNVAANLTRRQRRYSRGALVACAVFAAAATTGTAYAYWATAGSGSGSGSLATMTVETEAFSAGDATNTTLYPGGTADAILRLKNPNGFDVHVTGILATGTPAAGNNCSPAGVTFTAPTSFTAPQYTLAAGESALLHLPGAVAMSTSSASACQGQTFSLPVTVTVQK